MITRTTKTPAALALMVICMVGSQSTSAQATGEQVPLYERLGGLAPIAVVVSDFIDALVPDAVINANPAVNAARQHVPAAYLKYRLTALVCQATGSPCQYQGRAMKDSHAHLGITEPEWDRMVTIFKENLADHGVPAQETRELLDIVASTKGDIVAAEGDGA